MTHDEMAARILSLEQMQEAYYNLFLLLINLSLAGDAKNRAGVADGIQNILQHPDVLGAQNSPLLLQLLQAVRSPLVLAPDAALQARFAESPLKVVP